MHNHICICMYAQLSICTYIYIYLFIYIYIHIHIHIYIYIDTYIRICIYIYIHNIYIYIHIHISYIYIYICMYIHIYIYIYIHKCTYCVIFVLLTMITYRIKDHSRIRHETTVRRGFDEAFRFSGANWGPMLPMFGDSWRWFLGKPLALRVWYRSHGSFNKRWIVMIGMCH